MVVGLTRSGKSRFAKQLCEEHLRKGRRVVAIDVADEYSEHGAGAYTGRGPLGEAMTPREVANDVWKLKESDLSLAVVPEKPVTREAAARAFTLVHRLLQHAGDCVVVADEVGLWGAECASDLATLATMGSHSGLRGIFIAQRPALVPATVRSQCDCVVAFKTVHPADVETLRDVTGSEEFSEAVKRLPLGECLVWRANNEVN